MGPFLGTENNITEAIVLISIFLLLFFLPLLFDISVVTKNYLLYFGYCLLIVIVLMNVLAYIFKGKMYFFRGGIEYKNTREYWIFRSISLIVSVVILGVVIWHVYFSKK